ncbi:aldehyde dehydrogenase 3, member A2 [Entomortierella chlamydospora]|uniref:Aldehyde dehydrogenase n=1 Tax=Entomortierella chlamydospora TaxID=101097 RepID=A0A9P6N3C1_9FUNG|nr:aldehyde dehydrogenase 3, member A2 [Entomortierella chlamydospora]
MSVEYTPTSSIPKARKQLECFHSKHRRLPETIVSDVRASFLTHRTQSLEFRKEQLRALQRMVSENQEEIVEAIKADLNRNKDFEVPSMLATCEYFINNVESLTENHKVKGEKETFGLILEPLAGAIAAGNVAVVKPSEHSENSASVMTRLFKKYLDPSVVSVVNGGVEETTVLLEQRFDHILYTGNSEVAKIIMAAAAKHLTPVTLELGGKCPVVITERADLVDTAKKIAGWKTLFCGQVCVTVDYILCPKHLQNELIQNVIGIWKHLFGEDIKASEGYPKVINKRQHQRLERLLEKVKSQNTIVFGGRTDAEKLFVEPTIVTNVSPDDEIMKNEIFGPILPIITCETIDNALEIIGRYESPLGVYLFSDDKELADRDNNLPFGGVGHSGMGNYHGKFSIDTFSHKRAVLIRTQGSS